MEGFDGFLDHQQLHSTDLSQHTAASVGLINDMASPGGQQPCAQSSSSPWEQHNEGTLPSSPEGQVYNHDRLAKDLREHRVQAFNRSTSSLATLETQCNGDLLTVPRHRNNYDFLGSYPEERLCNENGFPTVAQRPGTHPNPLYDSSRNRDLTSLYSRHQSNRNFFAPSVQDSETNHPLYGLSRSRRTQARLGSCSCSRCYSRPHVSDVTSHSNGMISLDSVLQISPNVAVMQIPVVLPPQVCLYPSSQSWY
jgi:hypothetical protein